MSNRTRGVICTSVQILPSAIFFGLLNEKHCLILSYLHRYQKSGQENSSKDTWVLEQHTLENFAALVVSHHPYSIRDILERIHLLTVRGLHNKGLFSMFARSIKVSILLLF